MSLPATPRYQIDGSALRPQENDAVSEFRAAVLEGLTQPSKRLPCRFLYDEKGSEFFEQICELPEYYPTRAEQEILSAHAKAWVSLFDTAPEIIELGSGSSTKTRTILSAFLDAHATVKYRPIDISPTMLDVSSRGLFADFPRLEIQAIADAYGPALARLRERGPSPRLVLWLGSSIGNFRKEEAEESLREIADILAPQDRLLVGIDLRKDRDVLEAAYDDAQGVTARFTRNILERINRELEGNFDLEKFRHMAIYDDVEGVVRLFLESTSDQSVRIGALGCDISFGVGERIHIEDSNKYSFEEIDTLASTAGLVCEDRWLDTGRRFSMNSFRLPPSESRPRTD